MQRQKSFSILNDEDSLDLEKVKKINRKESLSDFLSDSDEEISIGSQKNTEQTMRNSPIDTLSHVNGIRHKSPSAGPSRQNPINPETKEIQGSSDSESEPSEPHKNKPIPGEYNPGDYADLEVDDDIKELFQFITKYIPQNLNLDYKFKPFIPDYIPAVGDIDAFIKVKPPKSDFIKTEHLGLTVLDEPSATQSDPALLHLQLRASSINATSNSSNIIVKTVEDVEKNSKVVDKWIKDINDLHKSKSSPIIKYTDPMPDLDDLMEQWPENVDNIIKVQGIPHYSAFDSLDEYVDVICAIFGIPVYKNRLQSLHLFFSLCAAVKLSQLNQTSTYSEQPSERGNSQIADQLVLD